MVGKKIAAAAPGADEEEAFPRGGGQGLAPVVQKRLERVWDGKLTPHCINFTAVSDS